MKKRLSVLLFAALMVFMFSAPVAASYRTIALSSSSGKWITQKAPTFNSDTGNGRYYVYKVVVPATGYLKIDISGTNDYDHINVSRSLPDASHVEKECIYYKNRDCFKVCVNSKILT